MTERQKLFADHVWSPQRDWSTVDEPLVFRNLEFELYASIPAVNRGVLREIDQTTGGSPKRAKAAFDGSIVSESDAMRRGRAAHSIIVEGLEAFEAAALATQCEAVKKNGDRCDVVGTLKDTDGRWYCGRSGHAPETAKKPTDYLKPSELAEIQKLAESIKESDALALLKRPNFEAELTIVFPEIVQVVINPSEAKRLGVEITEPIIKEHRVLLKTRVDRFAPPARWKSGDRVHSVPGLIVDLKTCQSGKLGDNDVSKAIVNNGLDIQAVLCRRALAAIGFKDCDFAWLFAESTAPFDCVVKDFRDDPDNGFHDFENAECLVDQLVQDWAMHEVLDRWPGVNAQRTPGRYPKWRANQLTEIRENLEGVTR